ncbi:uncharacterized protein LOC133886510 [Phragmites australis]|uniref:uncharacterized protein LOC133886510 n=1 Tax=Phragmites australis TaxID=29695 RepID=UPI002D7750FA|nr:uncharacterized protein LOC133886510 [Phragmites australis]
MRAQSDSWFTEYLLRIGGDTEEANGDGDVYLPDNICVPYTREDTDLDKLIDNFKRKQFPIRLNFTMTVNKAQGHTIPNVGIYLPEPVFSHGQLYVALSRATARANIRILAVTADAKKRKKKCSKQSETYTMNIVYKEVLTT